jgi:hypothetical protein
MANRIDTEFRVWAFQKFFKGTRGLSSVTELGPCKILYHSPAYGPWIGVCVSEAVPVASGAWHGLVWVKVLAR